MRLDWQGPARRARRDRRGGRVVLRAGRCRCAGKRVLVTAGPTYEDFDPVRYLGNRSSGRMGFAIAAEAARRGAEVTLVAGPTTVEPPAVRELVRVRSAAEMHAAVMARADRSRRRRHGGGRRRLHARAARAAEDVEARRHADAGARRRRRTSCRPGQRRRVAETGPLLVGFAAETEDVVARATRQARAEARRPHRRQRRVARRRGLRRRHQRGHDRRAGRRRVRCRCRARRASPPSSSTASSVSSRRANRQDSIRTPCAASASGRRVRLIPMDHDQLARTSPLRPGTRRGRRQPRSGLARARPVRSRRRFEAPRSAPDARPAERREAGPDDRR